MFTKDAIDTLALAKAAVIKEAHAAIEGTYELVVLPQDFAVQDLEKFNEIRRRARGSMNTSAIADFARYVKARAEKGASVFVDAATMRGVAVLNLGTAERPGHADNTATLTAERTAAYAALLKAAQAPLSQRDMAEFLEDWAAHLEACHGAEGAAIELKHAVDAVRRVTIEAARKVESTEGKLSAEKSAFESVRARSDAGALPTQLRFYCEPFKGLTPRGFDVRVAVRTGGEAPAFVLRVVKAEENAEQMAQEFAALIAAVLVDGPTVLLGSYQAKA